MGYYNTYYSDYCDKPSWVYRLYDAAGALLYVGMSLQPENRIIRHRARVWGAAIASYTLERFPNREEAKAGERWAIHHEGPLHNLVRPDMECC